MIVTKALLAGAIAATTNEDTRYNLSAINLRMDGTKQIAEATNGHIAIRITDQRPNVDADFPGNGLAGKSDATMIPNDVAAATIKALPNKSTIPVLKCAMIGADAEGQTVVMTSDLESPIQRTIRKPKDQSFPDLARVWPKDKPCVKIILSAELLKLLLAAVSGSCAGNKPRNGGSLTFTIPTEAKDGLIMEQIHASWNGETPDIKGEAVIMPMRQ